jgi:hypothetical protein
MDNYLAIIVSVALLIDAYSFKRKIRKVLIKGIETEGIIFDIVEASTLNSQARYPIVRFVTEKLEWVTTEYNVSVTLGNYKKGQKVIIVYNPSSPAEFVIKSSTNKIIPIGFLIVGIIFIIIGIIGVYKYSFKDSSSSKAALSSKENLKILVRTPLL